jgi:hypothetical protein
LRAAEWQFSVVSLSCLDREVDPNWWWTSELSDTELKQLIHDQISKSIELKEACAELGIPYVDVSPHFEASLDRAEAILNRK